MTGRGTRDELEQRIDELEARVDELEGVVYTQRRAIESYRAALGMDDPPEEGQATADTGDDGWGAVVSSAAQATPGPWRVGLGQDRPHLDYDPSDIVTEWTRESKHGMGTLSGAVIVQGGEWDNVADAAFVVALANWFFSRPPEQPLSEPDAEAPKRTGTSAGDASSGSLSGPGGTTATVRRALSYARQEFAILGWTASVARMDDALGALGVEAGPREPREPEQTTGEDFGGAAGGASGTAPSERRPC